MAIREVNKLVRDKVPAIIIENGEMPSFRMLEDDEFLEALNDKLQEEVEEYLQNRNLEELADILQVITAISEVIGGGLKELEYLSCEKAFERGSYKAHIFLETIDDTK